MTEVRGCSIAESKENSPNFMFPLGTTKGIAAQVTMGLAYVHFCGVGHGGEPASYHTGDSMYNKLKISLSAIFLLQPTELDSLTTKEIYERFWRAI